MAPPGHLRPSRADASQLGGGLVFLPSKMWGLVLVLGIAHCRKQAANESVHLISEASLRAGLCNTLPEICSNVRHAGCIIIIINNLSYQIELLF